MELLLIRHGLPVRRELEEGVADPELSEAGLEQAQRLGAYLHSEHLDAVYASPLRRAFQTAQPVAAAHGLEIVVEPDVAEFDRTSSEYVPIEELKAANDPRWQAMMRGEWSQADQSPQEFQRRLVDAIERLVDAHSGSAAGGFGMGLTSGGRVIAGVESVRRPAGWTRRCASACTRSHASMA